MISLSNDYLLTPLGGARRGHRCGRLCPRLVGLRRHGVAEMRRRPRRLLGKQTDKFWEAM